RRYRRLRNGIRQYYRDHYPLTPQARMDPALNPGKAFVSGLCHEPRVSVAVIDQLLHYDRTCGRIEVRYERKPVAADTQGDVVRSITLLNLRTGGHETIHAKYILDATELGD